MRVIAGTVKSFRLYSPEGTDIRPTSDRIKETIFNIISDEIPQSSVLDLFAGTGSLGIESLSRGAREAVFCDSSRKSIDIIKKNIEHTKFGDVSKVITADFRQSLSNMTGKRFDLIFLDPPYGKNLVQESLGLIKRYNLLNEDGLIIAEMGSKEELSHDGFYIYKFRDYSHTKVLFLKSGEMDA